MKSIPKNWCNFLVFNLIALSTSVSVAGTLEATRPGANTKEGVRTRETGKTEDMRRVEEETAASTRPGVVRGNQTHKTGTASAAAEALNRARGKRATDETASAAREVALKTAELQAANTAAAKPAMLSDVTVSVTAITNKLPLMLRNEASKAEITKILEADARNVFGADSLVGLSIAQLKYLEANAKEAIAMNGGSIPNKFITAEDVALFKDLSQDANGHVAILNSAKLIEDGVVALDFLDGLQDGSISAASIAKAKAEIKAETGAEVTQALSLVFGATHSDNIPKEQQEEIALACGVPGAR